MYKKHQISLFFITETWLKANGTIPPQVLSHLSRVTVDKKGSRGIAGIETTHVETIFTSNERDPLICKLHDVAFICVYLAPVMSTNQCIAILELAI
jgi:hypothetical protein